MKRLMAFLIVGLLAIAVSGAATGASSKTITLQPGKYTKVAGRYVGCKTAIKKKGAINLRIGFQVRIGGTVVRCVKRPTPIPAATPAPAPTPAPTPAPALGTLANAAPIGTALNLSNGWRLMVSSVTPNANAVVAAENMFNDPPAPGAQFFIATVMVTNVSSADPSFSGSFRLRARGAAQIPYTTFTNSCGVIPNSFLFAGDEAYAGGTIIRNVCWEISTADAGSLILFDRPSNSDGPFFKIH